MSPFLFLVGLRRDGRAMRERIYAQVQMEPGIYVAELAQRLGVSWHTAAYHLGKLAKARRLHLEKGERERRAFPAGLPARHRQWLAALREDQAVDVLGLLLRDQWLTVPKLSERLGFSGKIVRRHLNRLSDAGLLERRGELRPVYQVNPHTLPAVESLLGKRPAPAPDGSGQRDATDGLGEDRQ